MGVCGVRGAVWGVWGTVASPRPCPQGCHKADRPVGVRGVRVHQPAAAPHRGVRVRRPADTSADDPQLSLPTAHACQAGAPGHAGEGRCRWDRGRSGPRPGAEQPRARPAGGSAPRSLRLAPASRRGRGDRGRGRSRPTISKVHTSQRQDCLPRQGSPVTPRGINVRWCTGSRGCFFPRGRRPASRGAGAAGGAGGCACRAHCGRVLTKKPLSFPGM